MKVSILTQPDDHTCGPTSLHAVYQFYHHDISLENLINEINWLEEGGTLAVFLGIDALRRGFKAGIHSYNLRVFDPTWQALDRKALIEKLELEPAFKKSKKLKLAIGAYRQFLELGGDILFDDLTPELLERYFNKGIPVLAGLSATYLYQSMREYTSTKNQSLYDDLRGKPAGHFVVLQGISGERPNRKVRVADPYKNNPISQDNYYEVDLRRLINSILLGIVTYDANLLIIERPS